MSELKYELTKNGRRRARIRICVFTCADEGVGRRRRRNEGSIVVKLTWRELAASRIWCLYKPTAAAVLLYSLLLSTWQRRRTLLGKQRLVCRRQTDLMIVRSAVPWKAMCPTSSAVESAPTSRSTCRLHRQPTADDMLMIAADANFIILALL